MDLIVIDSQPYHVLSTKITPGWARHHTLAKPGSSASVGYVLEFMDGTISQVVTEGDHG